MNPDTKAAEDIFARCRYCNGVLAQDEHSYVSCINRACPRYRKGVMSEVFGPNGENPLTSPAVVFGKFLQEELKGDKAPITRPAQAESTIKAGRATVTRPAQAENIWSYRPVTGTQDQQLVESALKGQLGPSQQRIAEVGLDWIATLIKKNTDYGDSAWTEPVLAPNLPPKQAILVRMSDKINRLKALSQKEALVAESYNDTMKDLGAYALLYLAAPETK